MKIKINGTYRASINLPSLFFRDHLDRDLPSPMIVYDLGRMVVVFSNDPHLPELLSDANYYADQYGPDDCSSSLRRSAKATVRAINKLTTS